MNERKNNLNSIIIIASTLLIGIFNTFLISPEQEGTWINYAGYVFLLIAGINILLFVLRLRKKKSSMDE